LKLFLRQEVLSDKIQIVAISLTIFLSNLSSFLSAEFKSHEAAGPVLSCSNHTNTHSHVHSSTRICIMRVKETGAVAVLSIQLQIQEVLKHIALSLLLLKRIYILTMPAISPQFKHVTKIL